MEKTTRKRDWWDIEETKYFLELVRDRKVMKNLDGKRFRSEEIFSHLQPLMEKRGYVKTSKQIQMRFKTLRMQYNQCKKTLRKSGAGNCRIRFRYFDQMEELLGDRPISSQEGIDSTEVYDAEGSDALDNSMYDNLPDVRDGAMPGCSKDPEQPSRSQEEYDNVIFEENESRPCSPRTFSGEITETNSQQGRAANLRNVGKKKRAQSFQNVIYNYANIAKENAKELQNEVLQTQQTFLSKIMKEQREFETQLLQQMLDSHKQILGDLTNQLLNGFRTISQSPPGFIQIPSPMSSSDSLYSSLSPSPSPPAQNSTTPLVRSGCHPMESRPVRLILRPLSAPSLPVEQYRTTFSPPPPPSFRFVSTCIPVSAPNCRKLSMPASETRQDPADPSSFSNIHQINNQPTIILKPEVSRATEENPSPNPSSKAHSTDT